MDPGICRERLTELLQQELVLLGELETLLEEERDVIDSRDLEALERTTRARQARIEALAGIEEQRRSLARLHGYATDRSGLERLVQWCDPRGELAPQLRECRERALRCRDLNDRNGMKVSARLRRVGEALRTLTGRVDRAETYGPRGLFGRGRAGRILGSV